MWSAWTTQIDPATESVKVLTDVKGSVREWNPESATVHVKARRGVRPVFRDAMKRIVCGDARQPPLGEYGSEPDRVQGGCVLARR